MVGNMLVGGVLVVFAAIISFSALKWFPKPYLWIFLTWASVFVCGLVLMPRAKTAWMSLAVLVCTLAVLEGLFWVSENWILKDVRSEGTFGWVGHDVLGYVAAKGVAQAEAKYYRGEKIYDVIYTMDANGLRITSALPQAANANRRCVLFFGDAYTFGWG